jgi:hypothetical protein
MMDRLAMLVRYRDFSAISPDVETASRPAAAPSNMGAALFTLQITLR